MLLRCWQQELQNPNYIMLSSHVWSVIVSQSDIRLWNHLNFSGVNMVETLPIWTLIYFMENKWIIIYISKILSIIDADI